MEASRAFVVGLCGAFAGRFQRRGGLLERALSYGGNGAIDFVNFTFVASFRSSIRGSEIGHGTVQSDCVRNLPLTQLYSPIARDYASG